MCLAREDDQRENAKSEEGNSNLEGSFISSEKADPRDDEPQDRGDPADELQCCERGESLFPAHGWSSVGRVENPRDTQSHEDYADGTRFFLWRGDPDPERKYGDNSQDPADDIHRFERSTHGKLQGDCTSSTSELINVLCFSAFVNSGLF